MSNIQVAEEKQIAIRVELNVPEVVAQVQKIQLLMKGVMKEGTHYGVIPGTEKPTLLKSGAEKLGLTFRLYPDEPIVKRYDLPNGHREYEMMLPIRNLISDTIIFTGVGICTTMESKYRYRNDYEDTGDPVPKEYWKDRDKSLIGGKGFTTKKSANGAWHIMKTTGQIENPDIADCYNTVKKICFKRCYVHGINGALAASDVFNQDLEDFQDMRNVTSDATTEQPNGTRNATPQEQPRERTQVEVDCSAKIRAMFRTDDGLFSDADRAVAIRQLVDTKSEVEVQELLITYEGEQRNRQIKKDKAFEEANSDVPFGEKKDAEAVLGKAEETELATSKETF